MTTLHNTYWFANTSDTTTAYPGQWYEWNSSTTTIQYQPVSWAGGRQSINRDRQSINSEQKNWAKAKKTAEELLLENLTAEQREMYLKLKKFHIIGDDGERYELDAKKKWHNIYRLKEGKRVEEFCIYQSGGTPVEDNHLMQKLIVEADTELLKRVANRRILIG